MNFSYTSSCGKGLFPTKCPKCDCFHTCPCPHLCLGEDQPKPWIWMMDCGPSSLTLQAREHCKTILLLWSTKDITMKPYLRVLHKDKVTLALGWLLLADMPRAARTCVMLMSLRNVLPCLHWFWCTLVKFRISFNRGYVRQHNEVAKTHGRLLLCLLHMYVNGNSWEMKDQLMLSLNLKKKKKKEAEMQQVCIYPDMFFQYQHYQHSTQSFTKGLAGNGATFSLDLLKSSSAWISASHSISARQRPPIIHKALVYFQAGQV